MGSDFVVLGSGMAGLGAVSALRKAGVGSPVVFDKNSHAGGHTASHIRNGFIFDEGPHVSFTKNDEVKQIFASTVNHEFQTIDAYIDNYWRGHWIRHPVITNMHGMPQETVVECIRDFVASRSDTPATVRNYEEWLVASYGRAYAETFPMRYTEKYHTTTAANMSTEWVGPRLYQASLEEVLTGALSPKPPNIHYVQDYRYPTHGGFASFLRDLQLQANVVLNHRVTDIDARRKVVTFEHGATAEYKQLISSVPLPDLVPMIKGVPREVADAAAKLACTTLVLVNLGLDREDISKASWNYFYDDEFPFSRVSYPRNMSPHTVPKGCGSIQAEVYFSKKYRPLDQPAEACIEPVIAGLKRCGVIREGDRIVFKEAMTIEYANIIFDLDRAAALSVVHGYLDEIGIRYCGRYGEWGYLWTDEAFASGQRAAEKAISSSRARC